MFRSVKFLPPLALAFGCALLLSACGGGSSSGNKPTPPPTPQPSAAKSTITAAPTTVTADGKATAAITVSVRDDNGNPFTGSAEVDIKANPCSHCTLHYTNSNGEVTGTLSSGAAGDIVLSFTVNGTASPSKATVHFVSPSSPIAVHADFPSLVAGKAFTVKVSLTQSKPSSPTASVQVVDGGTATPQANCGQPRTVTINGAGASFPCSVAQIPLGAGDVHQFQVDINGKPGLKTPAAVKIVNGGRVDVQLTSAAGTAITSAAPGQTIDAAFSTTSSPPGVGDYAVSTPSGWKVAGNGACGISGGTTSCKVAVGVPATASDGSYAIRIESEKGSSPLSTDTLPVSVPAQSPTPANDLVFDLAQNISDTLYANLPGQAPTFTYKPVFLFKNASGGSLTITSVTVNGLTDPQYACNVQPDPNANYTWSGTPDCTLSTSGLYAVTGDLDNTFKAPPSGTAPAIMGMSRISISVKGGGRTFVQHDTNVTFVTYVPNHLAVRVVNQNSSNVPSLAAVSGPNMIVFDKSGVGEKSGDLSSGKFKADQRHLGEGGGLIYMPRSASDVIYLTRGTGGFNTHYVPSPTAASSPPAFMIAEMTYLPSPAGQQVGGQLYVDQSYVNFISMLASIDVMGKAAPLDLLTQDNIYGVTTNQTQAQIFSAVEKYFDSRGAPWAYVKSKGAANYIQKDDGGNITSILAPVQVAQVKSFDPMPSNYYDNYVDALWSWLETHPIYAFVGGIGESSTAINTTTINCTLQGRVETSGPNKGKLVFKVYQGTCPATAYSIKSNVFYNDCGASGDQPCTDTPNLVFDKFNACDFNLAAGSASCHDVKPANYAANEGLWGPNGTYRAQVGEDIAGYQAGGLLPPCGDPSEVMKSANAYKHVKNGTAFKNPTCLNGITPASPPTYNVYTAALLPYVNVYTNPYGDFLGIDGTVNYNASGQKDMPAVQPLTILLH